MISPTLEANHSWFWACSTRESRESRRELLARTVASKKYRVSKDPDAACREDEEATRAAKDLMAVERSEKRAQARFAAVYWPTTATEARPSAAWKRPKEEPAVALEAAKQVGRAEQQQSVQLAPRPEMVRLQLPELVSVEPPELVVPQAEAVQLAEVVPQWAALRQSSGLARKASPSRAAPTALEHVDRLAARAIPSHRKRDHSRQSSV